MAMEDAFPSTLWTLIGSARDGESRALQAFVLRYRPPVVAYCARRGLGPDAEDVTQEVFLRLFRYGVLLQAARERGRFRGLLLAVTNNVIRNHLERERAQKRGWGIVEPRAEADLPAAEATEHFRRDWATHLLDLALSRLAREHPPYHDALRLFVLERRRYSDIAREIGRPFGNVRNYIHRAKQKLRDYLREEIRNYAPSDADFKEELRDLVGFLG